MNNSHRFFQNEECKYFPCHKGVTDFNCLFCFCPLYSNKNCPGNPQYVNVGEKEIKVCTDCSFPHSPDNYDIIISYLK